MAGKASGQKKSNQKRRDVSPNADAPKTEHWKVTTPGRSTPTATASTQAEAERIAKRQTAEAGGGQVYIRRPDGTIRDADSRARERVTHQGHEALVIQVEQPHHVFRIEWGGLGADTAHLQSPGGPRWV